MWQDSEKHLLPVTLIGAFVLVLVVAPLIQISDPLPAFFISRIFLNPVLIRTPCLSETEEFESSFWIIEITSVRNGKISEMLSFCRPTRSSNSSKNSK